MDGSGYPHGLRADRIPLGARILLAVESYLAMTLERPYGMLSDAESLERVRVSAGRIYDTEVIAALAAEIDPREAAA
jgi:HD-GYP domain-containing protein (c-di-GMP phosphodiesterase class II)